MKKMYIISMLLVLIPAISGCGSSRVAGEYSVPEPASESSSETATDPASDTALEAVSGTSFDPLDEGNPPEEDKTKEEQEFIPTSPDASPMFLWEYNGYVDEAVDYYWRDDFLDTDYDEDGKKDRLLREYAGESDYCDYTIEFGNGRKIFIPDAVCTGFPHITGGDTDGDGEREILFTLTYDTSTDPYSFGNMWLYDLDEGIGEYREEELPLGRISDDARTVGTDITRDDHTVTIRIPELDLEKKCELGDDELSTGWYDFNEPVKERTICLAEIRKINGKDTLVCYFEPLMKTCVLVGFELNYTDSGYVMENPVYDAQPENPII